MAPRRLREEPLDAVLAALANPTRRDIVDALLDGEMSAGDIASRFEMARPSVSEHLRTLRECGLVSERASGRHRYYQLTAGPLRELVDWLTPYERFWRERMKAMSRVLDETDKIHD